MAVAAAATVATTAGLLPLAATGAGAAANFDLTRLFGANRYGTAAQIATTSFGPTAADVIVTTGENFPDALAGNYLAGTRSAPILLTTRNSVPAETQTALNSLNPQRVWVLGGTDAVGAGGVPTTSATVTRVQGVTRYETAVAANSTGTVGTIGGKPTAILATGDKFADALSAGPGAYAGHFPLYLTPGAPATALHSATKQALTQRGITNVIVMGGVNAISAAVVTELQGMGITVTRVEGADRTETARNFAEWLLTNLGFSNTAMNVARGDLYPDALTGGPHAGKEKHPILLTWTPDEASPGNSTSLGALKYASDHAATLVSGHIFGGIFAVSAAAEQRIEQAGGATTGNQALSVSGGTENRAVGATGARTCTVTVPTGGSVDLRLFPTGDISGTTGTVTFADLNSDNVADENATSATIVNVNGTPTGAQEVNDVATAANGTISVTIVGSGPTDVTLVAWVDQAGLTGQALDLTVPGAANALPKQPREPFGIGCRTTFFNEAASGAIAATTVTVVNKDADVFSGANGFSYFYDSNDVFQLGGGCTPTSMTDFETRLSPSDTVSGTYGDDAGAVSTFCLVDAAPTSPTVSGVSGSPNTVTLSITESATPTTDEYRVFRVARPASTGVCPDFTTAAGRAQYAQIGTVADPSPAANNGQTLTFTDTGLAGNTAYCYVVLAVDQGDESAPTGPITVTTAATTETTPPVSLDVELTTSGGFNDRLDAGDVITVCFDETMRAPDAGDAIQVTDGTDTATITNGSGATFALGSAASTVVSTANNTTSPCPAAQTLVITLSAAPVDTNTTTGDNILQVPATITDASGVTDVAGNNWTPVGDTDNVIDVEGDGAA